MGDMADMAIDQMINGHLKYDPFYNYTNIFQRDMIGRHRPRVEIDWVEFIEQEDRKMDRSEDLITPEKLEDYL
jgi:hypothetical protein